MDDLVEAMAEAISVSFHEEGYIEGVSDPGLWAEFQKAARAVLKAIEANGYAVVPKEPTAEMVTASRQALSKHILSLPAAERTKAKGFEGGFRVHDESLKAVIRFKAMVAAAPKVTS